MEMIRGKLVAVRMMMTMKMMNTKNHILLLEGSKMRWSQRENKEIQTWQSSVLVVEQMKTTTTTTTTKPIDSLRILTNKMPNRSKKMYFRAGPNI